MMIQRLCLWIWHFVKPSSPFLQVAFFFPMMISKWWHFSKARAKLFPLWDLYHAGWNILTLLTQWNTFHHLPFFSPPPSIGTEQEASVRIPLRGALESGCDWLSEWVRVSHAECCSFGLADYLWERRESPVRVTCDGGCQGDPQAFIKTALGREMC